MKLDTSPIPAECWFELREFFIDQSLVSDPKKTIDIPGYVIDSIIRYHLIPLNQARIEFGEAILISKNSCFRSVEHEQEKGRTGRSIHTFGTFTTPDKTTLYYLKGASDVTVRNMKRFEEFALIMARLPYTRLIIYPEQKFIHADYNSDNKNFYVAEDISRPIKTIRFEQYHEYAKYITQ